MKNTEKHQFRITLKCGAYGIADNGVMLDHYLRTLNCIDEVDHISVEPRGTVLEPPDNIVASGGGKMLDTGVAWRWGYNPEKSEVRILLMGHAGSGMYTLDALNEANTSKRGYAHLYAEAGEDISVPIEASPGDSIAVGIRFENEPVDSVWLRVPGNPSLPPKPQLQPIETAPRDGSYILLFAPSGYVTTPYRCHVGRWDPEYRPKTPWVTHSDTPCADYGSDPTHWMPLPY